MAAAGLARAHEGEGPFGRTALNRGGHQDADSTEGVPGRPDLRYGPLRALLWAVAFLAAALGPMIVAYIGPAAPREFWIEVGVGLGFVGFGMLLLQFVLTGRHRWVAASFGQDSVLQFHKEAGLIAVGFMLAHPALLVAVDPRYAEYLDPRVDLLRALALSAVVGVILLLVATSVWRLAFRLSYEWWRLVHGALSVFIVFVATTHILQVGHFVADPWQRAGFIAMGIGAVALVAESRLFRPWRARKRPYVVERVTEERGEAWTLRLRPEGHAGLRFRPGQFAWITLGPTPFSLQQHPYSFASSADAAARHLDFTIKAEGDFSHSVGGVEPGMRAFLEGPFGYFLPDPAPGVGCVMIAGGVGITPFISMLRTFADRRESRRCLLVYANQSLDQVILHDELERLRKRLELEVVHVLEEPPDDWEGETGLVDGDLLERHLPEDVRDRDFFICGPKPMMDQVERLLLDLGVPRARIFSERFDMV